MFLQSVKYILSFLCYLALSRMTVYTRGSKGYFMPLGTPFSRCIATAFCTYPLIVLVYYISTAALPLRVFRSLSLDGRVVLGELNEDLTCDTDPS